MYYWYVFSASYNLHLWRNRTYFTDMARTQTPRCWQPRVATCPVRKWPLWHGFGSTARACRRTGQWKIHGFPRNIIYRCWVFHIYVNLQDHPVTFGAFVCMWFDDLAIKVMNSVNSKIGYVVYWRVTCSYEYQRINGDTMVHGKDWDTFYH